jgi:coenzyme F420-dependent glucose-6-phosphate dehydrogenase
MPKILQLHFSWAKTDDEAAEIAVAEWPNGGMAFPKQDIRTPEDFAAMAKMVKREHFVNRMLISADLDRHVENIQHYVDLGFDEVHIHNVGRDQATFIDVFGREVLPKLNLSAPTRREAQAPQTPSAVPAG